MLTDEAKAFYQEWVDREIASDGVAIIGWQRQFVPPARPDTDLRDMFAVIAFEAELERHFNALGYEARVSETGSEVWVYPKRAPTPPLVPQTSRNCEEAK
jgi:hypothetical protein